MIRAALAVLVDVGVGDLPAPAARHDVHASHLRLVLDGTAVAGRIRLFHDDLQLGLRALARDSTLVLSREQPAKALFERYLAQHLKLEANGQRVVLHVAEAGSEQDAGGQLMMWYLVEGEANAPVTRLVMLQGVLFEAFDNQQNIVQLFRMPGEERRTLYFTAADPRDQVLTF